MPLYHATDNDSRDKILREGLLPYDRSGMNGYDAAYFFSDQQLAINFNTHGVILEVDETRLDQLLFFHDQQHPSNEIIYRGNVNPDLIVVFRDNQVIQNTTLSLFSNIYRFFTRVFR